MPDGVWDFVVEQCKAAAKQYGAGVVIVVAVVGGLLWLLHRSYMARLKDKDAEIQRLADSNKELLKKILKNPMSSESRKGKR